MITYASNDINTFLSETICSGCRLRSKVKFSIFIDQILLSISIFKVVGFLCSQKFFNIWEKVP